MPPRGAQVRGRGVNQGALVNVIQALANRVVSQPVLAVNTGGAATLKSTVVPSGGIVFNINGVPFLKANLSAQAIAGAAPLAATGTSVPANQFAMMRIELDSAGAVGTVQGGNFSTSAECQANPPSRSANKCTIGFIIMNNGAAAFVPGTTALDVSGTTISDGDPDLQAIFLSA